MINTVTNVVVDKITGVGRWPMSVAVAPNGRHVYVTNFLSQTVSVVDTVTKAVVPITVGRIHSTWQ